MKHARHHDTRHNDIQHNDTQHKGLFAKLSINDVMHNDIQYYKTLPLYRVSRFLHSYPECGYAKCH